MKNIIAVNHLDNCTYTLLSDAKTIHLTFATQLNLLIQRFQTSFVSGFKKAQLKEGEIPGVRLKQFLLFNFSTSFESAHLNAGAHMAMSFVSVFMVAKCLTEFTGMDHCWCRCHRAPTACAPLPLLFCFLLYC